MTWNVTVVNNSSNSVIYPPSSNAYTEGTVAVINVVGVGSIFMLDVGHQGGGPHYWAVQVTTGTAYKQIWWYDGGGACTLTINADNSFTLTGQGQTLGSAIGGPYLPVINLPVGLPITINAFSNAAYLQRLAIVASNTGGIWQWAGTGENNSPIVTNAQVTIPGTPGGTVPATVSIDYSPDGGQSWGHSNISAPSQCAVRRFSEIVLVSEDAIDNDWNDLTALVYWWTLS